MIVLNGMDEESRGITKPPPASLIGGNFWAAYQRGAQLAALRQSRGI